MDNFPLKEQKVSPLNRIREFIAKNEGTTEHKVAKYMKDNGYCVRVTTHNLIHDKLIRDGEVIDEQGENGYHKLYINPKDEFNKIQKYIDQTIQATISFKNNFRDSHLKDEEKRIKIIVHQLTTYSIITKLATWIRTSIKSRESRDTLFLRLVNILDESWIYTDSLKRILDGTMYKDFGKTWMEAWKDELKGKYSIADDKDE